MYRKYVASEIYLLMNNGSKVYLVVGKTFTEKFLVASHCAVFWGFLVSPFPIEHIIWS